MPPLLGLLQLLVIGFVIYLIALIVYTIRSLTHPYRQSYASAIHRSIAGDPGELDDPVSFEERTTKGIRGELALWVLPGKNPEGPRVVMTHGWGSSKIGGLKRLEPIIEHASSVVLWDLPGHGESCSRTRMGVDEHRDLEYILDATDDPRVDGQRRDVVLYGWSMGAGISLGGARALSDDYSIVGVICESAYIDAITPARNVIKLRGVPYRLNLQPAMAIIGMRLGVGPRWKGFARDQIAKEIELPMLVLHGTDDPVCPIGDGEAIAGSAPNAELVKIMGGGHNNLWSDEVFAAQMSASIGSFLSALSDRSRGMSASSSRSGSPARP